MAKRTRVKRSLPALGATLTGTSKGVQYKAKIVEASSFPDGKAVSLGNKLYRSLTAAATAVTKTSINGWLFWKIKE